jgi:hypothetical protein
VLVASSIHGLPVLCIQSRMCVSVLAWLVSPFLSLSLCLHCGVAHLLSLLGWVNSRSAPVSHGAGLASAC